MTGPLDPAQDPDRYDPARDDAPVRDPIRPGTGATLPELLGKGSFDDTTSPYLFLVGLVSVIGFLLLVAFVFRNLSPS